MCASHFAFQTWLSKFYFGHLYSVSEEVGTAVSGKLSVQLQVPCLVVHTFIEIVVYSMTEIVAMSANCGYLTAPA